MRAELAGGAVDAATDNAVEVLAERLGSIQTRARVERRHATSVHGPRCELVLEGRVVWSTWCETIDEGRVERHARWHVDVEALR